MPEYLFDSDLVRFAFIFGIIVSISLYDRLHVTTGSVFVPGYLGLFVLQPTHLLITCASGLLVFWIVHRVLPRYMLMYGRTKLFTCILLAVGLQLLFLELGLYANLPWGHSTILVSIGFLIPAFIAHDMNRNGVAKTLGTVIGAGAVVAVVVLLVVTLVPSLHNAGPPTSYGAFAFSLRWLPVAILLSVLSSIALQHSYRLRAGGLIGVAYLCLIAVNPAQVFYLLALSAITYLVVVSLLMPHLIIFGRRKFATMMLVGALLSWTSLMLAEQLLGYGELMPHSMVLPGLFLPGLFANDMQRVGIPRVIQGTGLSLLFTLCATLLMVEVAGERRIDVILLLAVPTVAAGAVVFGRYTRAWAFALRTFFGRQPGVAIRPVVAPHAPNFK